MITVLLKHHKKYCRHLLKKSQNSIQIPLLQLRHKTEHTICKHALYLKIKKIIRKNSLKGPEQLAFDAAAVGLPMCFCLFHVWLYIYSIADAPLDLMNFLNVQFIITVLVA